MKKIFSILAGIAILSVILATPILFMQVMEQDAIAPTATSKVILASVTVSPAPTLGATGTPNVVRITGDVYVRDTAGVVIGTLHAGEIVEAVCAGTVCTVDGGSVWRGCVDNNPEGLGCEAR